MILLQRAEKKVKVIGGKPLLPSRGTSSHTNGNPPNLEHDNALFGLPVHQAGPGTDDPNLLNDTLTVAIAAARTLAGTTTPSTSVASRLCRRRS